MVCAKVASHAYHLVCLAQEKAETQDQIDEVLKRLAVEETELQGLQAWLPVGNSQILRSYVFGPSGLKDYGSAMLRCKI